MKKYSTYPLIFAFLCLLTACEKVIDIKVNDDTGKLVIEGQINNSTTQQEFKLTRNVSFSSGNSYPAVTGATIIVHDDSQNEYVFREGTAGTYVAKDFTGIPGKTYRMEVRVADQNYTAQSQMPQIVLLDSIVTEMPQFGDKDTRNIKVYYKDPADQENQYRFVVFVNDKQTKDILATNDDFNNGNQVSLTIYLNDEDLKIYPGDKIRVEMQCIDKAMYKYWYSLMQQSGGGGITPSNPPTNISPTVLGYFSAFTTSTKNTVVK